MAWADSLPISKTAPWTFTTDTPYSYEIDDDDGERVTVSTPLGKLAAQVMNDKLSFIERDDSNITRCSVCSWWQNFVEELESIR